MYIENFQLYVVMYLILLESMKINIRAIVEKNSLFYVNNAMKLCIIFLNINSQT